MSHELTHAQRAKFQILAEGIQITPAALESFIDEVGHDRLTPADYASTSGVILRLPDDVWVNAPFSAHNPNFVIEPTLFLDHSSGGFVVRGNGIELPTNVWVPPEHLGGTLSTGRPIEHFVVTHGDRVRLSPMQGCSMACQFCDIPFERVPYGRKPRQLIFEALDIALLDRTQPARHLLISGGTPRERDIPHLAQVYADVLSRYSDLEIDVMMVPAEGLLDVGRLTELGVHGFSINLEVFNPDVARAVMPQKYRQGIDTYLRFIEQAVEVLGSQVRSMLMVGLEPIEDTLAGVEALLERGCTPVLSPFRPDPITPLRDLPPPSALELEYVFLAATDLAARHAIALGPDCPPCTHNTLTLGSGRYRHHLPRLI